MTIFNKRMISLFILLVLIAPTLSISVHAASPFKDVNTTHWAYSQIEWAYKKGIVNGFSDGSFKPKTALTEAQLVTIFSRYDSSYYSRAPYFAKGGEHYSAGYYRYFKDKNMPVRGFTNSVLRDRSLTRGQFARMVAAADGLDLTEPYAVQYFYSQKLSNGSTGKLTFNDFKPNSILNRAEAAVFLNRLAKRGTFTIKGLASSPTGKDDDTITLPVDFINSGTIVFPTPADKVPDKDMTSTFDSRLAGIDIEKGDLISNGVDSAFLTLVLKDCYGNPISYDDSLTFTVSSNKGASISGDKGMWSNTFTTDGHDMTVQVAAPKSTTTLKDTLSFKISEHDKSNINMSCYKKPVEVDMTYTPQAELRISLDTGYDKPNDQQSIIATIVRPGGQIITDYQGKVRFKTASMTQDVFFVNGVARIDSYDNTGLMDVSAEIIQEDSRYEREVASILNKIHRKDVFIDPYLQLSCPRKDVEIAFILDSSGSMTRNDPDRYRVDKTQQFISTFNATKNIASHFNSKGELLGTGSASSVYWTINHVKQTGGTNIGAGLEAAFTKFTNPNPKVAILVTDGKSSESKILDMLQEALDEKISVYTIGLGDKNQLNEELLQKIAHETGGQYFHVNEKVQLHEAYQSILTEITCDIPAPSCPNASSVFSSATIEKSSSDMYMNTYINEGCSVINRVIVRFKSLSGEIDYELIHRGQNYFAIKKGEYEIVNLSLYTEATFLAYDSSGSLTGSKTVPITNR